MPCCVVLRCADCDWLLLHWTQHEPSRGKPNLTAFGNMPAKLLSLQKHFNMCIGCSLAQFDDYTPPEQQEESLRRHEQLPQLGQITI
jgi:hypothetical protein